MAADPQGLYDDIINLSHHVSDTRLQMPMINRAAQCSPFAVLVGYDAAIKETGRLADEKIEMDEETRNILNRKFQILVDNLDAEPEVTFICFKPDERKTGGVYVKVTGTGKKVDDFERQIVTQNGTKIPMDNLLNIKGKIFAVLQSTAGRTLFSVFFYFYTCGFIMMLSVILRKFFYGECRRKIRF